MIRIRVGTRGSALALWQARHVAEGLRVAAPHADVELVEIASAGDERADVPLADVEGTGLFTAALERALAAGDVDVAVHSYKDLPIDSTPGVRVAAVPPRGPVEDVLCTATGPKGGATLARLAPGARVGTCSTRRTAQILAMRPDLDIRALRGNVPTRLERVARGELDGVVLARAGLVRLGLEAHVAEIFAVTQVLPAPAQGALAVECRADDAALASLLATLDHEATRRAVTAERALLHALGGGCSAPVGAAAAHRGQQLTLSAGVFAVDGTRGVRIEVEGVDPVELGERAARLLVDAGAAEILADCDTKPHLAEVAR